MRFAALCNGFRPTAMPKIAIVAALELEVSGLIRHWHRIKREHQGRNFIFFEQDEVVVVCGGMGVEAARRAAEAAIALYHPGVLESVGFAGALHAALCVGDIFSPAAVIDAGDASRTDVEGGKGMLITFPTVASTEQKVKLAEAYGAQAVDMEAAAVAAAARAHGIPFSATKVISDGLHFEMPKLASFIDPEGQFRTLRFAVHVALRPWLWHRVAQLAANSNKAERMLAEHLKALRPHLSDVTEAKTN
jgi:adenosylhomocysteine nucleosidase